MKKLTALLIAIVALWGTILYGQEKPKSVPADFKQFCQSVLERWNVPGMGVVVVKDGEVVFADGFGTTSIEGNGTPVTAQTPFVLASTSKAITAALLATLVDEGKVNWEDTVVKHLPDFKLYDDWVTRNFLVKDIMVHKTGFNAYALDDLPHFGYKRDDLYRIFRHVQPTYSYRTTYAYNNAMYTVTAHIIEKYTGMNWDDAITERLFRPLEMKNSTTGNKRFFNFPALAKGHSHTRDGENMKAALRADTLSGFNWLSAIAPAGFVISTAEDMGNWLVMMTGNGLFKGKPFLSEKTRRFLTQPQTVVSMDSTGLYNYAQGWRLENGRQGQIIYHTGLAYGYTALVAMVPDIDMGVAVLTNAGSLTNPQVTIMRELIEWYRGEDKRDWFKFYVDNYFTPETPRTPPTPTPDIAMDKPISDYTGNYFKADFGAASIYAEGANLKFKLKEADAPLKYLGNDKFTMRISGVGNVEVTFSRNADGKVKSLTFNIGDPIGEFIRQ
jgi:Beta-lactamase class C and other penicillin binding proteins